jgi:hypothetical protein
MAQIETTEAELADGHARTAKRDRREARFDKRFKPKVLRLVHSL